MQALIFHAVRMCHMFLMVLIRHEPEAIGLEKPHHRPMMLNQSAV